MACRLCPLVVVALLCSCAVDPSGLGAPRSDVDGGTEDMDLLVRDARPPDAVVVPEDMPPPDMRPLDMPRPDMPEVDMFVPPPDMCTPVAEICNGVDDDCNGMVDDGLTAAPCDGDGDLCLDGFLSCSMGTETCVNDEAAMAGDTCDGPDADEVADGQLACVGNALACEGDCTPAAESCNQRDDDCDGMADEGGVCDSTGTTCTSQVYGGSVYLFCVEPDGGDNWDDARDECRDQGYELVKIDDAAELAFLRMHSTGMSWWTEAHTHESSPGDIRDKSTWHWGGGSEPVDPSLWTGSEPGGEGSCGQLTSSASPALDDRDCDDQLPFICEAPLEP